MIVLKIKYNFRIDIIFLWLILPICLLSCSDGNGNNDASANSSQFGALNEIHSIDSLKNLSNKLRLKIEENTKKLNRLKEAVVLGEEKDYVNFFREHSYTIVKSDIAFVKKYPTEFDYDRTKFIEKGNEVFLVRIKEGHAYVEFEDPIAETTLKGWIDLHDLEKNVGEEN